MAEYTVVASDGKTYRVQGPEGLPEEIVRMDVDRRLRKQLRDSAPPPEPAPIERTIAGRAGEVFPGIIRGAVNLLETAATGASALLPEGPERAARERIASIGEAAAAPFQPKPGYEDSIITKGAEAAGSFVPFLAAGPFGLAGRVAATGLGAAAGAGTARERAEQGGATDEERAMATGLGSLVGLSEVVVPFRILKNAIGEVPASGVLNRLRRAAQAGGEEGLQEAAAEVAQNLIERGVYNPEQGAFTGTGESFGYGAGVGGLAQGLFDLFAPGRGRAPAAQPAEPAAETQPVEPVAPEEDLTTGEVRTPTEMAPTRLTPPEDPFQAAGDSIPPTMRPASSFVGSLEVPGASRVSPSSLEVEGEPDRFTALPGAEGIAQQERVNIPVDDLARAIPVTPESAPGIAAPPRAPRDPFEQGDVVSEQTAPGVAAFTPLTQADLDAANVPKGTPVRKRVVNNENPAQVKAELEALAANPNTTPEVAASITELVASKIPVVTPALAAERTVVPEVESDAFISEFSGIGTYTAKLNGRIADAKRELAQAEEVPQGIRASLGVEVGPLQAEVDRLEALRPVAQRVDDANQKRDTNKAMLSGVRQELDVSNLSQSEKLAAVEAARNAASTGEASRIILDAVDAKEGASKTIGTTAPAATATAPLSAADFERAVNSRIDKLSNPIVRQLLRDNGIDFRTGNEKERLRELKPVEKAMLANQVLDEDLQIEIPGRFERKTDATTINVDGVERPTTNSNGQPIHPTEEGLRNFWKWFNNSKVVDAEGRPLVLYKGLENEMEGDAVRSSDWGTLGEGVYLTSDSKAAGNFATGVRADVIEPKMQGNVLPVYAKLSSPFSDSFFVGNKDWQEWAASVIRNGEDPTFTSWPVYAGQKWMSSFTPQQLLDIHNKLMQHTATIEDIVFLEGRSLSPWGSEILQKVKEHGGFDGVVMPKSRKGYDEYVPYSSTQVKSAVGNTGAFDPARPSITASVQPKREEAAAIPANARLMDSVRRGNSSGTILQGIAQDKDVPQPLRNLARSMLRAAPNITVPVIERRYEEPDVVGEYVHPQNGDEAIYLDPRSESSAQTFLHEFVHPMTVNAIARGTPEGKRVVQLFEQYKAQHPESSAYGFTNPYEFVAEGITNPNFQSTLKRQNWWGRFVDAIRRIIGLPASQSGTVEELIDLTKRMGAAENITRTQKAAEQALTDQSPAANTKFLRVQGQQLKSASTPIKAPKFKRAVAALFDKGEEAVTRAMVWGLGLDQLNDYVQSYVKKKGPAYEPFAASFDRFSKIAGKLEGELRQFIDGITAQIARMGDWRRAHPEAYDDMNTLVYGGTLGKVDLTKPRSTYAGKPEQLKEYDRLEKVLNRLEPSGGAAIYRQMRTIYNRVFNGITQQVYDRVYSETQNVELATTIKNKFTEQMKLKGLEGYAALTRSNGRYRISYSLPGSDQKYFEIFENSADWKARQQQLLTEDGVSEKDMKPFLHGDTSVFDGIVPTSFMGDLVQTLKKNGANDNLLQAVMELGISVSPAQVVMERLAKRKETPGYTLDAFAAFQESVVGLQRKLINMKYSAQMSKEVKDMKDTRSNVATDPAIGYLIDEISSRAAYAANPNQNAISNLLTTGTYGWTLGLNVSSAIVDMLSLIVTGGYLSGRFKSRRKAHAALVKAGRDILGMGTTADVETMVTQGLEGAALQEAMQTAGINERDVTRRRVAPSMLNIDFNNPEQANKYGYLKALVDKVRDQGHSERFSDLEERAEFGESNILSKISARMGFMMSTSERYKRETGLKAFYDLALAEVAPNADPTKATKEQMEKAATEAMEMSRLLNGGSTPVTGPGFQRDNFWRVAFMYRSFAFRQMYVQVKTLYDATMNDEKSVRDAARKFGSTVLLTSGALVGVQGMPLFGPVALLLNVLAAPFVDDEEEEKFVQNMLRSNLDPLIYEGLPNALLNMGVSERASLTDLLMRDTNLPDDASFAETMAAHLGGPVVGSMERFWRGKGLIEDGQVQRGVESMVPVALSNILKSIRFVTDGAAETLRGDEVIEISPIAVVSQFMGFTPADYARTMELKSVQAGIDRRIGERKSNLYAAAYTAYRMGDSAGLAQVMQKMIEFNQQYPGEAIKNSDFKQSLRARARNSEAMLGGTLPRESRRAEWQEAADNWGVEFPE